MLNVVRHEVEVFCPYDRIPAVFEIDLEGLEIGRSIHISAVTMPDGVSPVITNRDFTIATIAGARKEEEAAATADAAAPAADAERLPAPRLRLPLPAPRAAAPAAAGKAASRRRSRQEEVRRGDRCRRIPHRACALGQTYAVCACGAGAHP